MAPQGTAPACRVFLFPGQSSVRPDAIARACHAHRACAAMAKRARHVLPDGDASAWLDRDDARLHSNRDVQVVVFLATQMYLAALATEGVDADCSMGLSLGEYSHLVHIGALDFEDALRLVEERGRRFDEAPPGMMVTVLAVDRDAVADVVARAGVIGHIVISNYNAPTQHVIAGDRAAVTWAADTLEDEYAAHTTVIERRVPMHSGLMAAPARSFARALARTPWKVPALDYRPNVTGAPIATADPTDFVVHLTRHVAEPVQWQASVNGAAQCFGDATFVEVGPGRVLHNMLARSWKSLRRAHVDDPESADPREHFSKTVEALRA